ncbi:hypothetical protein CEXT_138681 [Caerostris extrusa]|uniref:Uncharacterized protein n=1 Tax=Caerostris extrusa TaxID=172846 RepID=A0AAV4UW81_CAEEX|nr:hypothetical protein CEXT_138681 [Caerostris extrusa]
MGGLRRSILQDGEGGLSLDLMPRPFRLVIRGRIKWKMLSRNLPGLPRGGFKITECYSIQIRPCNMEGFREINRNCTTQKIGFSRDGMKQIEI